jgi:hypothetical protein
VSSLLLLLLLFLIVIILLFIIIITNVHITCLYYVVIIIITIINYLGVYFILLYNKMNDKNVCIYQSVEQMKISKKKKSKPKNKKKSKIKNTKMSKTKRFKQLGLKHLKSIHVTEDEIKWLQQDPARLNRLKYIEEELSQLIKNDTNKSKYRQPKAVVTKRKGATLGYIQAIIAGKSTAQLSVLKRGDKSKGNWKQYCSKIKKMAEGVGIMQLYNSPGFYNNLDCFSTKIFFSICVVNS